MDDVLIGVVVVACVAGWIITTAIRAKHGYPVEDMLGIKDHKAGFDPDSLHKTLMGEIAMRDTRIAQLEQRVEVLERIATDRPSLLSAEIDRLRTGPVN